MGLCRVLLAPWMISRHCAHKIGGYSSVKMLIVGAISMTEWLVLVIDSLVFKNDIISLRRTGVLWDQPRWMHIGEDSEAIVLFR